MGDLTDSACRQAKPKDKLYRLPDMGGMYLEVLPSGKKTFRLQYRIDGRQLTYTLGEYPALGLAAARSAAVDARMLVKAGRDPKGPAAATDGADTFATIAEDWFKANSAGWKPSHASRVWSRVARFLLPDLGKRSVKQVTPKELLEVLRKIQDRPDTAKRVREYAAQIWTFAIASDKAEINPAIGLSKALPKAPKQQPRAALTAEQLPEFFRKLRESQMEPVTALCIRLVAHTAVRSGELIGGKWAEIQGDRWIIPAARMKMDRDHIVPLSTQARDILRQLKAANPESKFFAEKLTGDTCNNALKKLMGPGVVTTHGWRSTFSTVLNDSGKWNPDAIERQLAHAPRNAIRAAYNRALHIEERTKMMQAYSDFLDAAELQSHQKHATDLSHLLS